MTRPVAPKSFRTCLALLAALAIVALMPMAADASSYGRGYDDRGYDDRRGDGGARARFHGWVEKMPEGLHGAWVIGGRQVTTNPRTEFDQVEGPLRIGGCAKVELRGGAVHEIDSEPDHNCR